LTEFLLAYLTILLQSADPVALLMWWQMNWKGFGRWRSNQSNVFTLDWGKLQKPVRIAYVMAKTPTKNLPDTNVECHLKPNYFVVTVLFCLTGQEWFTGHKPREFTGGLFGYVRWSHQKHWDFLCNDSLIKLISYLFNHGFLSTGLMVCYCMLRW
jgi:hypothetical protein